MPVDVMASYPPPCPRRFLSSESIRFPWKQCEPGEHFEVTLQRHVSFGFGLIGPSGKTPQLRASGVYVKHVEAGSSAADGGVCAGLRLLSLDGVDVQHANMADCAQIMKEASDQLHLAGVYDPYGFRSFDAGKLLRKEVLYRLETGRNEELKPLGKATHRGYIDLPDRRSTSVDSAVDLLLCNPCTKAQEISVFLSSAALELVFCRQRKDHGNALLPIHDICNVWLLGRKSVVIVSREIVSADTDKPAAGGDRVPDALPSVKFTLHIVKCQRSKQVQKSKKRLLARVDGKLTQWEPPAQ